MENIVNCRRTTKTKHIENKVLNVPSRKIWRKRQKPQLNNTKKYKLAIQELLFFAYKCELYVGCFFIRVHFAFFILELCGVTSIKQNTILNDEHILWRVNQDDDDSYQKVFTQFIRRACVIFILYLTCYVYAHIFLYLSYSVARWSRNTIFAHIYHSPCCCSLHNNNQQQQSLFFFTC